MERRQWIADRLIELDKKFSTFATESGVSESTAARWLSGECVPSPRNRRRMAKSLRISLKKLNGRLEENDKKEVMNADRLTKRSLLRLGLLSATETVILGQGGSRTWVGAEDVEAVRSAAAFFSRLDQRHGGAHGRTAVNTYLMDEVGPLLQSRFRRKIDQQNLYSAAGELAYVAGWMAFDSAEYKEAGQRFDDAIKLAHMAGDMALSGHILRAQAHQALEVGHVGDALRYGSASVEEGRYRSACKRERALLNVVYARSLAMAGEAKSSIAALGRAESELGAVTSNDDEPDRVFFFGEASLAHETARTLHILGESEEAIQCFRRSVAMRNGTTFRRTHVVTLGYLGSALSKQGRIDEACDAWNTALDCVDGIRSARTHLAILAMHDDLASFKKRKIANIPELNERITLYLRGTN